MGSWRSEAGPKYRGKSMMHALPRGAGSPRYKVKQEALYRDWPAAHTALLERYRARAEAIRRNDRVFPAGGGERSVVAFCVFLLRL
jgi:hypothetical protein